MIGDVTGTRAVIATVVSLSVLSLGGCSGDDPEPRIAPPSSSAPTSPSTTPASGPTEPVMPDEARGTDAKAAAAFVKFYLDVADYAQATGELDALRRWSSETCKACQSGIDAISNLYQEGGVLRGGGTSVRPLESSLIAGGERKAVRVTAEVANRRQELDLPGSADDRTFPPSTVTTKFVVERRDSGWVLSYWADV
jgi:hypothetical protein